MGNIENSNRIEIIDTETVDKNLDELSLKSEEVLAIGEFRAIESWIKWYDIDLAIDRKNNWFYIISGENVLNIPLSIEEIGEVAKILKGIFNAKWDFNSDNEELLLRWKQNKRRIVGDWGYLWPEHLLHENEETTHGFVKDGKWEFVNQSAMIYENNITEEIFKFAQKVKWIPIENWNIKWVCKWPINKECKQWLWFSENDITKTIKQKARRKK